MWFFDINLWFGRPDEPRFDGGLHGGMNGSVGVQDLLRHMDRYCIERGVVTSFSARNLSPETGNRASLEAAGRYPRLRAGLVLTPELARGHGSWHSYLSARVGEGACLVRLFPKAHNFSLAPWCAGEMLEALATLRLPLLLWHTEAGWDTFHNLCTAYPTLPVIAEGTPQKLLYHNRAFYPLLRQHKNFYLELHNLVWYGALEDIAGRFGADRLLFGSYMPLHDPNAIQMTVTDARIPGEDKLRIAHGNLDRLLSSAVAAMAPHLLPTQGHGQAWRLPYGA